MSEVTDFVFANSIVAGTLLLGLLLLRRFDVRPGLIHVGCLFLLLKLITPPIWTPPIRIIPTSTESSVRAPALSAPPLSQATRSITTLSPSTSSVPDAAPTVLQPDELTPSRHAKSVGQPSVGQPIHAVQPIVGRTPTVTFEIGWRTCLLAAWGIGTAIVFTLSMVRIIRFRRFVRDGVIVEESIRQSARRLAGQLGLSRTPRLKLIRGGSSPMLWCFFCRAEILLPRQLWQELNRQQREALLLHELAHYRRGDHWVRFLELAVTTLYWWNPILWGIRKELRRSEEQCCDEFVVSILPEAKRSYAEAIVKSVDSISGRLAIPLSTGMGSFGELEDRLTKIMVAANRRPISRARALALTALATATLLMTPMLAQTSSHNTDIAFQLVTVENVDAAGVELTAFHQGARLPTRLVSDDHGVVRITPESFPAEVRDGGHVVLLADDKRHGFGWIDLGDELGRRPQAWPDRGIIRLRPRAKTIEGRFVDLQGVPIPDVRAVVSAVQTAAEEELHESSLDGSMIAAATSDKEGRFRFQLPAEMTFTVRVDHRDWVARRLFQRRSDQPLSSIALRPAGRIEGRVVDTSGNPLAGQRIAAHACLHQDLTEPSASWATAVSDRNGRFEIGGLPTAQFNVLHLGDGSGAPLAAPAIESKQVRAGTAVEANFRVERSRRIFGKVVDAIGGAPLPKIDVGYYGTGRPDSGDAPMITQTASDGSFEFHVPPGSAYVYVAQGDHQRAEDWFIHARIGASDVGPVKLKAGRQRTGQPLQRAAALEPIRADQAVALQVNLKVPTGRTLPQQFSVRIVSLDGNQASWVLKSGTKFELDFQGPPGPHFLVIDAAGFLIAESQPFTADDQSVTIALVAESFAPIRGQVIDQTGAAVSDARVRVRRAIDQQVEFPWGREYRTDARGRFSVEHVRIGDRVQIRVDHTGTAGTESPWLKANQAIPIELANLIVRAADQKLGGTVRDQQGRILSGVKVSLTETPKNASVTDSDGRFRLKNVPAGRQEVAITFEGRRQRFFATAGKLDNDLRIDLGIQAKRPRLVFPIHLTTSDGKLLEKVDYYGSIEGTDHVTRFHGQNPTNTSWDMAAMMKQHAGKKLTVSVGAKGYKFAMSKPFEMKADPLPVELTLEASPSATLTGRAVDATGKPVAGAHVAATVVFRDGVDRGPLPPRRGDGEPTRTDAQGRFTLPDQHVGSHVAMYVKKDGFAGAWSDRVELRSPGVSPLAPVVLRPGEFRISGEVRDYADQFAGDVTVELLDIDAPTTTTDAKGRFTLTGLGDRKYPLRITSPAGYWNGTVDAGNTKLKIRLTRGL